MSQYPTPEEIQPQLRMYVTLNFSATLSYQIRLRESWHQETYNLLNTDALDTTPCTLLHSSTIPDSSINHTFFSVFNMGFVVVPATLPDIRAIYDVWFAAFKGQLILDLIYPGTDLNDEAFRKVHTEGTLEYWKGLSMEHTFQCIDTDTGKIAGMATWQVYWRERTAEERQKPWIGWLEGDQRERAEGFLGQLWEKREKWIGPKRHVCEWSPILILKKH